MVQSRAIGGATVECPRIAPQRNGIRERDSRRDGRVFFRAPQYVRPINCVLSTPLLLKKDREMKAHAFYTVSGPRVACREEGSDWLNLER